MEALRVRINGWIRDSALFDYMLDADALLRDQKNPSFTDERYHQGDHLHPNQPEECCWRRRMICKS